MSTKLHTMSFPAIYIKPSYVDRLHERILRVHEMDSARDWTVLIYLLYLYLTVHQRTRKTDVRWEEIYG